MSEHEQASINAIAEQLYWNMDTLRASGRCNDREAFKHIVCEYIRKHMDDPYDIPDKIIQSVKDFGVGKCWLSVTYTLAANDDDCKLDSAHRTVLSERVKEIIRKKGGE